MTGSRALTLAWVGGEFSIARLDAAAAAQLPASARFVSITRTGEELSIVGRAGSEPEGAKIEGPYALFRVAGELPLGLTGILASLLDPLAAAGVPIFAISTFDTDYVMVRAAMRERAESVLAEAGHRFVPGAP